MPVIIALLLATGSDRCASAAMCPTDQEIVGAIRNYEIEVYQAAQAAIEKEEPGGILMMTPQIFRRISDVYCAAPWPGESDLIRCKFTAVRGLQIEYYSGKMKRTSDGWLLIDPSIITRKTR